MEGDMGRFRALSVAGEGALRSKLVRRWSVPKTSTPCSMRPGSRTNQHLLDRYRQQRLLRLGGVERKPRIVIVEYNSSLPLGRDERLVQPYAGTSDGPAPSTLAHLWGRWRSSAEKGYSLVHTDLIGVNAFFVRDDLTDPLPTGDRCRGARSTSPSRGMVTSRTPAVWTATFGFRRPLRHGEAIVCIASASLTTLTRRWNSKPSPKH